MLRTILSGPRTVIAYLVGALATIVLGTYALILGKVNPTSRQIAPVMRTWARIVLWVSGVSWTVHGLDNIDRSQSYVVVSNHISNLDPPFHIASLPVSIRFLAKKELFKVPLFGSAMRSIGIVETDRAGTASAHRAINTQVEKNVERGLSLMIYPEGTRSRDGQMRPFKKGAFRIAADTDLPIVPVAITGTDAAFPPGSRLIRGGKAVMAIGEPIPTADVEPTGLDELRDRVKSEVERLQGTLTSA
ncbi:MAG: lysophospholipid acyltransferase family protein [Acidimicrobiia bacterium]|nr:lysophospholipid acyltransferase family protein [Acidimicrobiia bacterium]